jgi:cellulose biosynthesis protein BcsQ
MSNITDKEVPLSMDINIAKTHAEIELKKIEAKSSAKDVASKAIGKWGLFYITLIVLIGVGSSYFLSETAITAVMTMIGGALVALISMLQSITATKEKEEKPEFDVMNQMITELNREKMQKNEIITQLIQQLNEEKSQQMSLNVDKDSVTVTKGGNKVKAKK